MEKPCAGGKPLGSACAGPASRLCGACGAIRYCSALHQRLHWAEHKLECRRYEQQMSSGTAVHDFPFSFTHESIFLIEKGEITRCAFLQSCGLHMLGLWQAECECRQQNPSLLGTSTTRESMNWHLPPSMCPCKDTKNATSRLESWADYYAWRELPLASPVAILVHWPLTLYHSLMLVDAKRHGNMIKASKSLQIHYLGPEQELDQLEVFGELRCLLHVQRIEIDFVGPAVPKSRNAKQIDLKRLAECSDAECNCKSYSEGKNNKQYITLRFWRGPYHAVYENISKNGRPDLIIAPNAGIAVYSSWLPTLKLIASLKVPAVFTDFCEEAAILASDCIKMILTQDVTILVQVNPFRQPIIPRDKVLELPTYSNCFLFGID